MTSEYDALNNLNPNEGDCGRQVGEERYKGCFDFNGRTDLGPSQSLENPDIGGQLPR